MKYNPKINEKVARIPGFAESHPLQEEEQVQGSLESIVYKKNLKKLLVWMKLHYNQLQVLMVSGLL